MLPLVKPRKPTRISLTPLIDVVFILLLFFMLSSTFSQWHQLSFSNTTQTNNTTAVTKTPNRFLLLGLNKIKHQDRTYNLDQLEFEVLTQSLSQQQAAIIVTPNTKVTIQELVNTLDYFKAHGLNQIHLTSSYTEPQ